MNKKYCAQMRVVYNTTIASCSAGAGCAVAAEFVSLCFVQTTQSTKAGIILAESLSAFTPRQIPAQSPFAVMCCEHALGVVIWELSMYRGCDLIMRAGELNAGWHE